MGPVINKKIDAESLESNDIVGNSVLNEAIKNTSESVDLTEKFGGIIGVFNFTLRGVTDPAGKITELEQYRKQIEKITRGQTYADDYEELKKTGT